MSPIVAGLLVDVAAFAVLGIALAVGVPWEKVSPFLYILLGAKAVHQARRAIEPPPAPPQVPPSSSGQGLPPAPPSSRSDRPPPGTTLRQLALTSGVVALLLAVPALLAARARS